jgi:hypothetical protein
MAAIPSPRTSFSRMLMAIVSLVSALVVIAAGFVLLVTRLEGGAYNERAMVEALGVLGIGGGLMALGIGLLIWELAGRYDLPR